MTGNSSAVRENEGLTKLASSFQFSEMCTRAGENSLLQQPLAHLTRTVTCTERPFMYPSSWSAAEAPAPVGSGAKLSRLTSTSLALLAEADRRACGPGCTFQRSPDQK